ncbi:MAG: lipid A biosynthesis acyltransferase [gamma proteobacterium symbiont of Ctena orbiculata]|nr:MAG: lipid A biosynthesis acyltransferase [gamma proteobacterium symbiont of Ctena orbiculata]PVV23308.1 MAG: lipid A biosynthesis acyltransferase [gamma proteobacterium symbiont of Ctena orbiculata]PVV26206.1 MAG: lipid A biosynthesis acyltransferase [gamma proteobacterium symbiont of Ctena orbiculata]
MAKKRKHHLYSPRYWPTWAGMTMLWLLSQLLPYSLAMTVGRLLGKLIHRVSPTRRHIAAVNLSICFPEKSEIEREQLLLDHFHSLGIGIVMIGFAWWARDEKLRSLVEIEGIEHLQQSLDRGKGTILLSAHFTDLEITGRLLSLFQPIAVMYRPHENPVIEWAFSRNRRMRFEAAIARNDIRQVVRTLRQNLPVWYAPDQSFKGRNSILAPFFGEPAGTNTATSRLAKISGADVILFSGYRKPNGSGYHLVIHPPLNDFPTEDVQQDATRINGLIEMAIGYAPEQYLWIHRRFKKRKVIPDPY